MLDESLHMEKINHQPAYISGVNVIERFRGFELSATMLRFAEKLMKPYMGYITFMTQLENENMQKAGRKAGYFFANSRFKEFIIMAKPFSCLNSSIKRRPSNSEESNEVKKRTKTHVDLSSPKSTSTPPPALP